MQPWSERARDQKERLLGIKGTLKRKAGFLYALPCGCDSATVCLGRRTKDF